MKLCEEMLTWHQHQQHLALMQQEEEAINLLEKLIMFLPPARQQIMALHYLKGVTTASIAIYLQLTETHVMDEIRQALDFLRKVTATLAQKPARPRWHLQTDTSVAVCEERQSRGEKIFRMRHQDKYSFSLIATKMSHSPIYIHQAFIEMHAWLHRLRQTG